MTNPTFSVVIPAYNAEATLGSTVDSVLRQSDQDFEIMIVDDGSTDATVSVMHRLANADERIRIVSQANEGVSAARNFGASLARGELLAFLDADDEWAQNKLRLHRAAHDHDPLTEASFARVVFCPEQRGEMITGHSQSKVRLDYLDLGDVLIENPICTTSNLVVSRAAFEEIGGFSTKMRYAEDQELLARVIAHGMMIRGIDAPLVRYRMSENGLSCNLEAMFTHWRSFAEDWISADELRRAEAIYCRYLTRRALRSGAKMNVVRSFVRRGMAADSSTFAVGDIRSLLTLGGVIAGTAMPAALRRAVFA